MPRVARSSKEVEAVKDGIIRSAMRILVEEEFDNLTMEKVGASMNMTAANIYRYFANKADLFLGMHKRTFDLLYDVLSRSSDPGDGKLERVHKLAEAYVRFGIENPNYYEIMFSIPTPKYVDFVGTPLEEAAREARRNSLRILELAMSIVGESIASQPGLESGDAKALVVRTWCTLHGLISLYNNRLIAAIDEDPETLAARIVEDALRPLRVDPRSNGKQAAIDLGGKERNHGI